MENPEHVQHGVKSITVNGKAVNIKDAPIITEDLLAEKEAVVKVVMG